MAGQIFGTSRAEFRGKVGSFRRRKYRTMSRWLYVLDEATSTVPLTRSKFNPFSVRTISFPLTNKTTVRLSLENYAPASLAPPICTCDRKISSGCTGHTFAYFALAKKWLLWNVKGNWGNFSGESVSTLLQQAQKKRKEKEEDGINRARKWWQIILWKGRVVILLKVCTNSEENFRGEIF